MKRVFAFLLAAAFIVLSCSKEPSGGSEGGLRVVSSSLVFEASGGDGSIVLESAGTLEAASAKPWLSVSVEGSTVKVHADANTGYQSRYSKITIRSREGGSISLIAQQMGIRTPDLVPAEDSYTLEEGWSISYVSNTEYQGEKISVLEISGTTGSFYYDIITADEFTSKHGDNWASFIESSAADVLKWCTENGADPSQSSYSSDGRYSWPLLENGSYAAVLYGVDAEFTPTGSYNYALFTVKEEGQDEPVVYRMNQDWSIVYNGRTSVDGTEYEHISYKLPTGALYYVYLMTQNEYQNRYGSDISYFVEQIAAYLKQQGTELMRGPQELRHPRRNDGDYIALAFGLNEDYSPTGDYQQLRFSIGGQPDASEAYTRWTGTWDVVGRNSKNTADSTYFTVTISPQLSDRTYALNGWGGEYFQAFGNVLTKFNTATGGMTISTFNVATGLDLERDGHSWVVGLYCFVRHNGREVAMGGEYDIATGTLSSDGKTASFEGLEMEARSGAKYEPLYMWWAGFSDDDRWTSYRGTAPGFPFKLIKK